MGHQQKSEFRLKVFKDLETQTPFHSDEIQDSIQKNLENFLKNRTGFWAGFFPLKKEPRSAAIHFYKPRVFPRIKLNELEFVHNANELKLSNQGVFEPIGGEVIPLQHIQGVFVPGVAFDQGKNRLGRGKGYYDQTLRKMKCIKVGLCFSCQIYSHVPTEEHDISMDFLLSEKGVQ